MMMMISAVKTLGASCLSTLEPQGNCSLIERFQSDSRWVTVPQRNIVLDELGGTLVLCQVSLPTFPLQPSVLMVVAT